MRADGRRRHRRRHRRRIGLLSDRVGLFNVAILKLAPTLAPSLADMGKGAEDGVGRYINSKRFFSTLGHKTPFLLRFGSPQRYSLQFGPS